MEKTNVKNIPNEKFFGEYISNKKIYSFEELEKEGKDKVKKDKLSFLP